jgi:hypothetical protein
VKLPTRRAPLREVREAFRRARKLMDIVGTRYSIRVRQQLQMVRCPGTMPRYDAQGLDYGLVN